MTDEPVVLYEVSDHVATITLNRPERGNAATFELGEQLQEAFRRADKDRDARVVILTGAGKHFCTGDDVEAAWGDPRMAETMRELADARPPITPESKAILDCRVPTIAAVNGSALGIGMDLAVVCDFVIASDRAKFGQLFVKMGLMADFTGYWRLPQLVGLAKASELLFTGDIIDAAEAERIGLVSRVVPGDDLMQDARAIAARIAANPPLGVRYIKEGLRRGNGLGYGDLDELAAFVGNGLARLFTTKDHAEASAAFLEKRAAVFTGE
ncbi:MAG TPA: enoyl-CoA hydratase-related protein [Acidimicrobiales bacterium]|nr:enoyl-CoA hydratase-related protein [Acidimicrobiales bacterium]